MDSNAKVDAQCIFCNEQMLMSDTFYENELWRARWDAYPVTPGHAEILPRRHVQYFDELTDDELSTMMSTAKQAMQMIRETELAILYESMLLAADDRSRPFQQRALESLRTRASQPIEFNLGLNDGPIAGQSVPHLHLHIMPRYQGDVENPRGGVRNILGFDQYNEMTEDKA